MQFTSPMGTSPLETPDPGSNAKKIKSDFELAGARGAGLHVALNEFERF
jgi:hypothetical protein